MTKTAITNDKPKGATDRAVELAVNIAFELGKQLGARGAGGDPEPIVNNGPRGIRGAFKLPAGDRPGHIPPKADGSSIQNRQDAPNSMHRAPKANGFLLPKAEG